MSKITASTVLFYIGDENRRPLEKELLITGADKLFRGINFPSNGITFLYGHKNPAVAFFLRQAAQLNLEAAIVDVHIEIGLWGRQKIDFSDDPVRGLCHFNFLNLARAKKEVTSVIESLWVKELGAEVASKEDWPKGGTRHPYLFEKLIKLPEFKHLTAIAYMIKTAEVGDVQVVTVFDDETIVGYRAEHLLDSVELVL